MYKVLFALTGSFLISACGGGGSAASETNSIKNPLTIFTGVSYEAGDSGLNPRWVIEDFNKDGLKDIFIRYDPESAFSINKTGTSPVRFFLAKSTAGFEQSQSIFVEGFSPVLVNRIIMGDFNGDGGNDILIATAGQDPYVNGLPAQTGYTGEYSQILTYTPNGYKLTSVINNINTFAHHASTVDINGDKFNDVFIASLVFASPFFIMGNSSGQFQVDTSRLPNNLFGASKNILERFSNNTVKAWENFWFTSSAFIDANNDGYQDIALMAMSGTKTSIILLNDGTGNFSSNRMIELPVGPYGAGYAFKKNQDDIKHIEVGTIHLDTITVDINGDGRTDIISLTTSANEINNEIIYYRGSKLQILVNTGNGFIDETIRANFSHTPSKNYTHYDTIEYSDVNNDKCKDILIHRAQVNYFDDSLPTKILLNDCKGNFNEVPYPKSLPIGILTVLGENSYAIFISQKNGNTYTQRIDHVTYDWSLGKSLF